MIKKILFAPILGLKWLILLPFRGIRWLFRSFSRWFGKTKIGLFFNEIPEDNSVIDSATQAIEDPSSFFEQLDIARGHLLRSIIALIIGVAISFTFTEKIISFLAEPVGGLQNLQAIEVTESISVFMRVALLSGIALATPYIIFEIWLFIAPGLMPTTRKLSLLIIPFGFIFFIGGMYFSYALLLPTSLPFLMDFMGVATMLRPQSYFNFITGILFWIGVAFEFPLIIFGTSYVGLTKPQTLLKNWRIAILLIAVISAMVTPTVDPVNMSLVMAPMIVLYFLSIFFSWLARIPSTQKKSEETS
ncbi:MAG TPA: twin-arginine translocase subunit TatC [Anaerolineales bacterium]|nr:twin-arginine translocase subunit TatC [Anaerolineales bacterium]